MTPAEFEAWLEKPYGEDPREDLVRIALALAGECSTEWRKNGPRKAATLSREGMIYLLQAAADFVRSQQWPLEAIEIIGTRHRQRLH